MATLSWYELKILLPYRNIWLRTTLQATTSTHAIAIAQRRYAAKVVEVVRPPVKVKLVRDTGAAQRRINQLRRTANERSGSD